MESVLSERTRTNYHEPPRTTTTVNGLNSELCYFPDQPTLYFTTDYCPVPAWCDPATAAKRVPRTLNLLHGVFPPYIGLPPPSCCSIRSAKSIISIAPDQGPSSYSGILRRINLTRTVIFAPLVCLTCPHGFTVCNGVVSLSLILHQCHGAFSDPAVPSGPR